MTYNTLFIVPPTKSLTVSPPIGLLYLATILKNKGVSTKIIDCLKDTTSWDKLYKTVINYKPHNICLSTMTCRMVSIQKFITDIRKLLPDVKIIIGGPHASALPQETFTELNPDILVTGEAENIIFQIINALNKNNFTNLNLIPGIVFRNSAGNIVLTPGQNHVEDLNALPIPDWSLLPPNEYPQKPANLFYKAFPIGSIITSRGCKYNCPFCASKIVFGKRLGFRSPEHVLEEIKILTKNYQVKEIHFFDDNFINKKEHAYSICQEIINEGIKIFWKVPSGLKINDLDDDLIEIFKRSGCYQLGFGIESLDENVLQINRKEIDIEKAINTIKKLKKMGIETYGYFIIGLPGENKDSINNTFKLLPKMQFDYYHFSIFTPIPGSYYYHQLDTKNNNWSTFNYTNGTNKSYCALSHEEVKHYHRKALLASALNIRTLLKIIHYIKVDQVKYFIELISSYWRK
jgi:anaerobic magnesium-protoporphyrin IX monomethyl ester cyclase